MRLFQKLSHIHLLTVLCLLMLIGLAVTKRERQQISVETYFRYDTSDIQTLTMLNSPHSITPDRLWYWDEELFRLVKKYSLAPTTASRIYAYYYTGQSDAINLSLITHGSTSGSIDTLSSDILCTFFAEECSVLKKNIQTDEFSHYLATVVQKQLYARFASEQLSAKPLAIKSGFAFWNGASPVTPDAGNWKSWILTNPKDFRAPQPPMYGSENDSRQVTEVKVALAQITTIQKEAVNKWAGGRNTVTPAGLWIQIMNNQLKQNEQLPLQQIGHIRAVIAQSLADAFIVCWDNKYYYSTKRPFMRSNDIAPIIPTPNFPSYPSGHSLVTATAATLLSHYFPQNANEFIEMAHEAKNSRLWAGIHFPVDNEEGFKLGQEVGNSIVQTLSATKNLSTTK